MTLAVVAFFTCLLISLLFEEKEDGEVAEAEKDEEEEAAAVFDVDVEVRSELQSSEAPLVSQVTSQEDGEERGDDTLFDKILLFPLIGVTIVDDDTFLRSGSIIPSSFNCCCRISS